MHWITSGPRRSIFAATRRASYRTQRQTQSLLLCVLAATTIPNRAFLNPSFVSNPRTKPRFSPSPSSSYSSTSFSTTDLMMTMSTWNEDTEKRETALKQCVVPLSPDSYKGSSGRVGVLGGSARYTGAPYYAAMSSLKVGADLAFVFCAQEASGPIKCYSPELMVAPVYSAADFDRLVEQQEEKSDQAEKLIQKMVSEVTSMMNRLHVLVIGPGLGRCPLVLEATSRIIRECQTYKVPLIVDADALYLFSLPPYRRLLLDTKLEAPVVLTPNAMERKRMQESLEEYWNENIESDESTNGCLIVIEKGQYDVIKPYPTTTSSSSSSNNNNNNNVITCGEVGGLKRCGGLGDLLAGSLGTVIAWNNILTTRGVASSKDLSLACWAACCFVKRSTNRAYHQHRRSMTAPDVLAALGPTIDEMTTTEPESKL